MSLFIQRYGNIQEPIELTAIIKDSENTYNVTKISSYCYIKGTVDNKSTIYSFGDFKTLNFNQESRIYKIVLNDNSTVEMQNATIYSSKNSANIDFETNNKESQYIYGAEFISIEIIGIKEKKIEVKEEVKDNSKFINLWKEIYEEYKKYSEFFNECRDARVRPEEYEEFLLKIENFEKNSVVIIKEKMEKMSLFGKNDQELNQYILDNKIQNPENVTDLGYICLLYTSEAETVRTLSRQPSIRS